MSELIVNEGSNAYVTCTMNVYQPNPLKWRLLNSLDDITTITRPNQFSYTLALQNITRAQNGTYICFLSSNETIFTISDIVVRCKHQLNAYMCNKPY